MLDERILFLQVAEKDKRLKSLEEAGMRSQSADVSPRRVSLLCPLCLFPVFSMRLASMHRHYVLV